MTVRFIVALVLCSVVTEQAAQTQSLQGGMPQLGAAGTETILPPQPIPVSSLLKNGTYEVPALGDPGQWLRQIPQYRGVLELSIQSVLDSTTTYEKRSGDRAAICKFVEDPAELEHIGFVMGHITDHWGMLAAGLMLSDFAMFGGESSAQTHRLLFYVSTTTRSSWALDRLTGDLSPKGRKALKLGAWFADLPKVLDRLMSVFDLLGLHESKLLVDKASLRALVLVEINPSKVDKANLKVATNELREILANSMKSYKKHK